MTSEFKSVSSLLPSFGFSSEQMGTEDNIAAWRETTATFFDVDELAAGEAQPFRADLHSYALGSILLGMARASGQRFRRTAVTIARSGVDHIIMQLYVKGGYEGVADDRPIRVEPGDICVLDLARTFETKARAFENVTLVVPRPMFDARLLQLDDLHGLVLPGSSVLAQLLARHLSALLEYAPRMTPDECQAAVEGTVALASACLRGELERRDADRSAAADASLFRIRQHIEVRLSDPELDTEAIALHFGLSRASLYRLVRTDRRRCRIHPQPTAASCLLRPRGIRRAGGTNQRGGATLAAGHRRAFRPLVQGGLRHHAAGRARGGAARRHGAKSGGSRRLDHHALDARDCGASAR